ncbi:hypothetical protein OGAPHI_002794 [Ogataea philodendri]|uniref:Major facilitator superfamily (MFS) profile domain-containing protein n=1 Tax=Ogataea philodendri TaxID=1378263 RepID=A0A9P8T6J1_9ASCO|nr:uncharacterized protein OGAPHI_002794 [Ogataea philodendri]KAH3667145.1 hypothetical protein OGAPHI_002794 [Ogataea philodendri]
MTGGMSSGREFFQDFDNLLRRGGTLDVSERDTVNENRWSGVNTHSPLVSGEVLVVLLQTVTLIRGRGQQLPELLGVDSFQRLDSKVNCQSNNLLLGLVESDGVVNPVVKQNLRELPELIWVQLGNGQSDLVVGTRTNIVPWLDHVEENKVELVGNVLFLEQWNNLGIYLVEQLFGKRAIVVQKQLDSALDRVGGAGNRRQNVGMGKSRSNRHSGKFNQGQLCGFSQLKAIASRLLDYVDRTKATDPDNAGIKTTEDGIVLYPQPSDSPNDPLNWGTWTKMYQFALLAFITGFTAATSNDAGSTQDSLNEIYGISYDSMNTGAGVLFASIGLTTVILGPFSSLYGRKISYVICIILGLVGAVWFALSKDTSDTIWSQLFVGASEACAEAQVQLSLSDMYFSHQLGGVLTVYILATSVGTYLGPLIAGFIVQYTTFRWVGWVAVIISGGLLAVMFLTQYETYFDRSSYIGQIDSKEKTLNVKYDEKNADTQSAERSEVLEVGGVYGTGAGEPRKSYWKRVQLITPSASLVGFGIRQYFQRLILMLRVFWFPPVLLSGLLWGLQDAFLTFYLTTEDDQYYDPPWNYSNTGVALMNLPCVIGALVGCIYAGYFSDWFVIWKAKRNGGIQEAEFRLWFVFPAAILSPLGLLIFGIGTEKEWSWKITYTIGLGFIGFGFATAGDTAMAYLMDAYPEMVLEGMLAVAFINNMIGCIFTFVCSPLIDALGNVRTYVMLAVIDIGTFAFVIPFLIYGKQMRQWTKNQLRVLEQRGLSASQWRVGLDDDALLLAVGQQLETWVLLHQLPGLDVVPLSVVVELVWVVRVLDEELFLGVGSRLDEWNRPVHQVQVDVVQTKSFQRAVQSRSWVSLVGVPHLSGDENRLSWHTRVSNGTANVCLVLVNMGSVNVSVANLQGVQHRSVGVLRRGLPASKGNGRNRGAGVKLLGFCGNRSHSGYFSSNEKNWFDNVGNFQFVMSLFKEVSLPTGEKYQQPIGLFINNEWVSSDSQLETIDPATEKPIVSVYAAGEKEVDQAVAAARGVYQSWLQVPGEERALKMHKLADLLEKNADLVAKVEAMDSGKPFESNAKPDILSVVEYLRYCAGWADKIHGKTIPLSDNRLAITRRYPLVVGQIVPWNYPLSMSGWKFCPALACGCPLVIKSSELTPLSLLLFAQYVKEAGFPAGVFNVISGFGAVAGQRLASHPDLDKVAFTGSTATGAKIMQSASANLKNVSLECGGKSPLVVFEDADLEKAAKWASFGVMYNSGQNCTANSRILVQDSVYEKFLGLFRQAILDEWKIGDPFDSETTMGPVISKGQFDKIKGYIESGKKEGARVVLGDEPVVQKAGYFIQPTVFADCNQDMKIVREEIFGPVVAVSKFQTEEEAVKNANDTIYGLAAMVFSKDFHRAHRVAEQLEAGSVYINSSNDESCKVPFGGFKMSGIGRELGESGIDLYTQSKSIFLNIGNN